MPISIIVAYDRNLAIGKAGLLPWKIPADLKNFKKITMGNCIVMGRKTFESIGKPLPGRKNVILSRNKSYNQPGCLVLNDPLEVLNLLDKEIFIIGGGEIYSIFLPYATKLYITEVNMEVKDADAFFPQWDQSKYKLIDCNSEKNEYSFKVYQRVSPYAI